MRRSLVGAAIKTTVLVIAATAGSSTAQQPAAAPQEVRPANGQQALATHVTATDGHPLAVTVIDTQQRVMAVYHVDRTTGEITLKSVRNLSWDLQMLEYNSGDPIPQAIRDMSRELQQ